MRQITADEYLIAVPAVVNHSDFVRHAVLGHHGLAIGVACLISWDAPVVISSKIISSAIRPPKSTMIFCSILPFVITSHPVSGSGMV